MIHWLYMAIPGRVRDRLACVPFFRWLQDHGCIICGRPTRRRTAHWPCERELL